MDDKEWGSLAKVRMERAEELLLEAEELLANGRLKSANNRAFYSIEKSIKALLAMKRTDAATHNGVLKQFNYFYIYQGDGVFGAEDYQRILSANQIRSASDYDDFYIASKTETERQVADARELCEKVKRYLEDKL